MNRYEFIIDTNQYSGNFQHELCAYITGHISDAEIGKNFAEMFKKECGNKLLNIVYDIDDYDCLSPVSIIHTPNYWNNGVGGRFQDGQEDIALEKYKQYMINDLTKSINMYESYKIDLPHTWTINSLDETINGIKDKIEKIKDLTQVNKYPSYQSVCICFEKKPSKDIIDLLKERTKDFFINYRENEVEIIDFRFNISDL